MVTVRRGPKPVVWNSAIPDESVDWVRRPVGESAMTSAPATGSSEALFKTMTVSLLPRALPESPPTKPLSLSPYV